jgi:subtilisin family serine protease
MSFPVRGPGWPVVALATAAVVVLLGFSVSTQGRGNGRRIVRVNGADAVEGEVLLKYRDGGLRANRATLEAAVDAETVDALDRRGTRRIRSRRLRTTELIDMLSSDPDVEYVEPNYVIRSLVKYPNDPFFTSLWALYNTGVNVVGGGGGAGFDIDARTAWDTTTGGRTSVVAILDSGVDYNHVDLAVNMWSAPAAFNVTIGGVTVTCAAGTHGFNAVARNCNPMDDHFHGTHAAGVIGAVGNNGIGVTGVNWTTSMMAVKILGSSGSGTVADAVAGLEFVVQAKAAFPVNANIRVLSNSWASSGSSVSLVNAIKAASDSDMLFVAAAGNNGSNNDVTPVYPASYGTPNIVAVAASTNWDELASFSNYGATSVDLAAPGQAILSTVPGNAYAVANGTSMATPYVSGAAMLALTMCQVSTQQLRYLLLHSVYPQPTFSGTASGGRLYLSSMVENCPYPKVTSLNVSSQVSSPQPAGKLVRWLAQADGGVEPYQFRWLVYDGTAWTTAQDWATGGMGNGFEWTPTVANDGYRVMAQVRSAWNAGASELSVSKPFEIKTPISAITLTPDLMAPQPVDTTITWTATAAGGEGPLQYRFYYWYGWYWVLGRDWNTSNTYVWTPDMVDSYARVQVQVRSAWNTGNPEASLVRSFAIENFVTNLTLSANKTAPQAPGTSVTFTAEATGGTTPRQYRFSVWDGAAWTVITPWDTSTVFTWTPVIANANYKVQVQVRSQWNTGTPEKTTVLLFPIRAHATSATLTPSLTAPQAPGTAITWTASAAGGEGPYQFRFLSWINFAWVEQRAWSTSNTFAWTPPAVDLHAKILVEVRSVWNTGAAEFSVEQSFPIRARATGVTLQVTNGKTSPQFTGSTVEWTAHASGGEAPYQYKWSVWDGSTWAVVVPWSSTYIYHWTPSVANSNYRVAVQVRSAWNTGTAEVNTWTAFPIMSPVSSVTVAPNLTSPRGSGTAITFTATATGGTGPLQYRWIRHLHGEQIMQDWSTNNVFVWTPTLSSDLYQIEVQVRSEWNTQSTENVESEATIPYAIKPVVGLAIVNPNLASPQQSGTTIRWTANASGGVAPYQYLWVVWNGSAWINATTWSTSNTFDWTPATPNANYKVAVRVRSAWNTGAAEITAIQPFPIQ